MEKFPVIMVVCLLAGLSECQHAGEDSQTQITELTHEDIREEKDALQNLNQELEMPAILTTNSTSNQLNHELLLDATVRALEEANKKLSALDSKVAELSALEQAKNRVAFSAALPRDGTIGPVNIPYPLVYRHVLYNVGGHYSPVTGYFTAPVQGAYYFTFTSFFWGGEGISGGSLYHNENQIVSWYGYSINHPISGTNSAVVQLQVGDHVNVRLWENLRISDNGNKYSSFSGFLLFPM